MAVRILRRHASFSPNMCLSNEYLGASFHSTQHLMYKSGCLEKLVHMYPLQVLLSLKHDQSVNGSLKLHQYLPALTPFQEDLLLKMIALSHQNYVFASH